MMEPEMEVEAAQVQPQINHSEINGTIPEQSQDSILINNGVDYNQDDNQVNEPNGTEASEQLDAPSELPQKDDTPLPNPVRTDSQIIKESVEQAKQLAEEEEAADRVRRLRDLFGKMGEVKKTKKIAPRQDKIPDVMKYRPADEGKPKVEKKKFRFDVSKHGYVPKFTKNQARAAARMANHGYMPGYIGTHRAYANMDHGYVPYMSSVTASDAKLDHGFIQFNNQPKTVSVHWDHGFMPNSISRDKFGQSADHGYVPIVPKSGSVSNSMDQMGRQSSGQDSESVSGMNEDDLAMFASVQMLRDRFTYEPSESQSYSYNASTVGPEQYGEDEDGVTQVLSGGEEGTYDSGADTSGNGLGDKESLNGNDLREQGDRMGDDGLFASQIGQENDINGASVEDSEMQQDQDMEGLGLAKESGKSKGQSGQDDVLGGSHAKEGVDTDSQGNLDEDENIDQNADQNDKADQLGQEGDQQTEAEDLSNLDSNEQSNLDSDEQQGDLQAEQENDESQKGVEEGDDEQPNADVNGVSADDEIADQNGNVDHTREPREDEEQGGPGKLGNIDLDIPMVVPGNEYEHKSKPERDPITGELNYNEDYGKVVLNEGVGLQGNPDGDEYGVEVDNGQNLRGNKGPNEYGIEVDNNKQLMGNKGNLEYGGEYESAPKQAIQTKFNEDYGGEWDNGATGLRGNKGPDEYGGEWESNPVYDPNVIRSGEKVEENYEIDLKSLKNMWERK